MTAHTTRRIPLVDLRRDGGTQVRETMNAATVQDYADALAEGVEFPAVTVFFDGEAHWLADGFHRVLAHERAGLVDVLADVRAGTKRDALRFALGANRGHGLQMSPADKRRVIEIMLRDREWQGLSNNAIAKELGVSDHTVAKVRGEVSGSQIANLPETRTGKDGKQYPAKKTKAADPTPAPPAEPAPAPLGNFPSHPAVAAIASAPTRDALDAAYTAANSAGLSGDAAEEAGRAHGRKLKAQTQTIQARQCELFGNTDEAPATASRTTPLRHSALETATNAEASPSESPNLPETHAGESDEEPLIVSPIIGILLQIRERRAGGEPVDEDDDEPGFGRSLTDQSMLELEKLKERNIPPDVREWLGDEMVRVLSGLRFRLGQRDGSDLFEGAEDDE